MIQPHLYHGRRSKYLVCQVCFVAPPMRGQWRCEACLLELVEKWLLEQEAEGHG